MTVPLKSLAVLAVVSLTLPGCSALFGSNKLANQTGSQSGMLAAKDAATLRQTALTDAGRRALDQGNTGIAIDMFTRAVRLGEAPAPAMNGLGVAYARIGRFDLAQRYFQRAAEIDPADARYQNNLARLMRSPLFAKRHEADQTRALMAQASQQQEAESRTRQAAAPGQLQRIGANQFFIQTAAPAQTKGPVRTAMVIARKPAATAVEAKPVDPKMVEAVFDASVGKAAAPAEEKQTPRTIHFTPIPAAKR